MNPEAASKSIKFAPHCTWKKMGQEIVVLDLNSGYYFTLNPTAAAFWENLVQGAKVEEVAGLIATEFNISAEIALVDLVEFLEKLRSEHLIEWA